MLFGVVCACDAPPQREESAPVKVQGKAVAAPPPVRRVAELAGQCESRAREQFRRGWRDGKENGADGAMSAEFMHHYNGKMNTCFYLLTVTTAGTLKRMLFDVDSGELYGEYLGPAQFESPRDAVPKTCRVESFYCASGREWDVLVAPYLGRE